MKYLHTEKLTYVGLVPRRNGLLNPYPTKDILIYITTAKKHFVRLAYQIMFLRAPHLSFT